MKWGYSILRRGHDMRNLVRSIGIMLTDVAWLLAITGVVIVVAWVLGYV